MANIRSAYAELTTTALTEGTGAVEAKDEGNIKINAATEGSDTLTATVTLTQTKAKWQTSGLTKIGSMDAKEPTGGATATVTVKRDGSSAEITYAAKQ